MQNVTHQMSASSQMGFISWAAIPARPPKAAIYRTFCGSSWMYTLRLLTPS